MGSDEMDPGLVSGIYISIHAPRMGSDFDHVHAKDNIKIISIHAPRMGSDVSIQKFVQRT